MEFDSAKIQAVRPFIFDYVAGVLWLIASGSALVREEHVHRLAKAIDIVAAETPHVKVPALVIGFILAIAGVILPYCVNVVLKRPTLYLLNKLLALQRRITPPEAKKIEDLTNLAMSTIQRYVGAEIYVSSNLSLLYLETLLPTIGANLSTIRQEIAFKAYIALPLSFSVGFLTARYASTWMINSVSILIGVVLGVGSFVVSVSSTNKMLEESNEDLAIALLIADAKRETFTR